MYSMGNLRETSENGVSQLSEERPVKGRGANKPLEGPGDMNLDSWKQDMISFTNIFSQAWVSPESSETNKMRRHIIYQATAIM
ncbi:unnamed protein product [Rhizoctonia solani]|uniref:Uncharacterized protein n=2 Tax=Rhizoctonia solani TaxID=456999 RepID=A0A8H3HHC9_9AGAM